MEAMVLNRQGKIENSPLSLEDTPKPIPGPNEVCIEVSACGVCRTDLHIIEGDLALRRSPIVPGHQIIGAVSATGSKVKKFRKGDRVGATWINSTCGKCRFCTSGRENLCDKMRFTGWDVNGGYAEYVIVSEDFAYPVSEDFDDVHAAPLFCAGIIGYRGLKLSCIKPGGTLAIFGFGSSAHIITQIARHLECDVFAFTRGGEHRDIARSLGASWVGELSDEPPRKVDAAVITAPVGDLVINALKILDKGAKISIIDIHMSDIPKINYDKLLYGERSITSVTNYTRDDVKEFLNLAKEIPIKTRVQKFKLKEANRALNMLKKGKLDVSGVLTV